MKLSYQAKQDILRVLFWPQTTVSFTLLFVTWIVPGVCLYRETPYLTPEIWMAIWCGSIVIGVVLASLWYIDSADYANGCDIRCSGVNIDWFSETWLAWKWLVFGNPLGLTIWLLRKLEKHQWS